jgi:hypothetical protein
LGFKPLVKAIDDGDPWIFIFALMKNDGNGDLRHCLKNF